MSDNREYLHNLIAGAGLPFLQASLSGLIVFVAGVVICYAFKVPSPWTWGGVAGVLTWAGAWVGLQRNWRRLVMGEQAQALPAAAALDIPQAVPVVRVKLIAEDEPGKFQESIFDLPGDPAQLGELAQGLADGASFSEAVWCGAGKPYSLRQFRELRAALERRGLIAPVSAKDLRQGWQLTAAGRAVMRRFIPSPAENLGGLQRLPR